MSPFVFGQYGSLIGSGGGSPTEVKDYVRYDFDHLTVSPFILEAYASGKVINQIVVNIEQPFDIGKTMTIGFVSTPDQFIQLGDIDMTTTDEFQFPLYFQVAGSQILRVTFAGLSAVGSGFILVFD